MPNTYGSVPEPQPTLGSLHQCVLALKQGFEILTRQRRPADAGAVTWADLVDLGLIDPSQVPKR